MDDNEHDAIVAGNISKNDMIDGTPVLPKSCKTTPIVYFSTSANDRHVASLVINNSASDLLHVLYSTN